jgi:hypothetical protein
MRQPDRGIARGLPFARQRDALGDFAAAFGQGRQDEIGGGHRRHFDMQVDAVEQRSGKPRLVLGGAARVGPAPAGEAWLIGFAAAAGIHRRDQHEAGRIGEPVIGAGDRDLAGLKRLTQRIEGLRLEFRQLVQEQHPVMRQRDFARARMQPRAGNGRHRGEREE